MNKSVNDPRWLTARTRWTSSNASRTTLAILMLMSLVRVGQATETVDFERDIAPILEERCWYCHGEDEQEDVVCVVLVTEEGALVLPATKD